MQLENRMREISTGENGNAKALCDGEWIKVWNVMNSCEITLIHLTIAVLRDVVWTQRGNA